MQVDDGQVLTVRERMQMLKLQEVTNARPYSKRPIVPLRPASTGRDVNQHGEDHSTIIGNLPAPTPAPRPPVYTEKKVLVPPLPRRDSVQPAVPPRRPSESLQRRGSQDSITSTTSSVSALSAKTFATTASRTPSFDGTGPRVSYVVKAPAYDPTTIPQLPPPKTQHSKRPSLSISRIPSNTLPAPLPPRSNGQRPPPLPSRRISVIPTISDTESYPPEPQAAPAPLKVARQRVDPRTYGMNKERPSEPLESTSPREVQQQVRSADSGPPPIPSASRPDLASLLATKPKFITPPSGSSPSPNSMAKGCLICRDYSAPDSRASMFPRQNIPSADLSWLAHQLTEPFPSATDKARAIFTWLHFNIIYNVEALFSGNLKHSTPASTFSTGLAVCEGYAGLFTCLATHAGLESIVIGGHGKGYGHKALSQGDAVPPFDPNHAWNAVRIDGGQWKLIDACWGAGHLGEDRLYHQRLDSGWFTKNNDEFGLAHFPKDRNHFFRTDGRVPSWEEYLLGNEGPGEPAKVFTGAESEHGLSPTRFGPSKRHVKITGVPPKTRMYFRFEKICEHYDLEKAGIGKPYVFVLAIGGRDGKNRTHVPFQTNGRSWFVDVAAEDLGRSGQVVQIYSVTSVNGEDGRGMSPAFVKQWIGRRAMSFGGIAEYLLI